MPQHNTEAAPDSQSLPAPTTVQHGEEGVWLFIFGDMMFFGLFFVSFLFYRAGDPAGYDRSQILLNQSYGLGNTLLLLTSSWCVAQAVHAFRVADKSRCRLLLMLAIGMGIGFVLSKSFEWSGKFADGITVQTNEFFMFYFMLTGIHLIHVLLGIGVLCFVSNRVGGADNASNGSRCMVVLESGAAFWHLVDLLWVVLFALLYLVR